LSFQIATFEGATVVDGSMHPKRLENPNAKRPKVSNNDMDSLPGGVDHLRRGRSKRSRGRDRPRRIRLGELLGSRHRARFAVETTPIEVHRLLGEVVRIAMEALNEHEAKAAVSFGSSATSSVLAHA